VSAETRYAFWGLSGRPRGEIARQEPRLRQRGHANLTRAHACVRRAALEASESSGVNPERPGLTAIGTAIAAVPMTGFDRDLFTETANRSTGFRQRNLGRTPANFGPTRGLQSDDAPPRLQGACSSSLAGSRAVPRSAARESVAIWTSSGRPTPLGPKAKGIGYKTEEV
jgi:hypothetical protein